MIWALRALANGVELQLIQQGSGAGKAMRRRQSNTQPVKQTGGTQAVGGVVRAFLLSNFIQKSDNWSGPKSAYAIEISTILRDWSSVATNDSSFTDSEAPLFSRRFYRAKLLPPLVNLSK